MASDFPLLHKAFRTGAFEELGGWAHAIPPEARAEIRELLRTVPELASYRQNFPCDGGCNVNSGPEEECSLHGRGPRDLWNIIGTLSGSES